MTTSDMLIDYLGLCTCFLSSESMWRKDTSEPEIELFRTTLLCAQQIIDDLNKNKREDWYNNRFRTEVKSIANRIWQCIYNRNDIISPKKFIVTKPEYSEFLNSFGITQKRLSVAEFGKISGEIEMI